MLLPYTQSGKSAHGLFEIFPPTKRNQASERIDFPNGVYLMEES